MVSMNLFLLTTYVRNVIIPAQLVKAQLHWIAQLVESLHSGPMFKTNANATNLILTMEPPFVFVIDVS
jgi:hypothetical protein